MALSEWPRAGRTLTRSKNKHLLDAVVQQRLPETLVEQLAAGDGLLLDPPYALLLHLRLPQRNAVQRAGPVQVRDHELVGELVLLLLVSVDHGVALEGADGAGDDEVAHADAGVDEGEADAVEDCALGAALVLDHAHQDLDLVLLVELLHDRPLEAPPDVLRELAELAVVLPLPLLQRAERRHRVLDPQQEVGVVGALVGTVYQADHLGEALPQQTGTVGVGVDAQLHARGSQLVPLPAVGPVLAQSREINIDHCKSYTQHPASPKYYSPPLELSRRIIPASPCNSGISCWLIVIIFSCMSIYSGFPTRRDEQKYNSLLSKLILTLQTHLLELIGDAVPAQGKVLAYGRIIAKMKDYEEHKYLPPKFTELVAPLCRALGIAAATEQRILPEAEERSICQEKIKVSTQSLNKYRARSHFQLGDGEDRESRVKMDSMVLPKQMCNDVNASKRSHFQSEFDLKERKLNPNILPPREEKLKSSENYDEPEQPEKWTTLIQTRSAKGANVAKLKASLRYQRAFHGLQEEGRRKGPLREDQRKLKTSECRPE